MPAAKKNSKGSEKGTWNALSAQIPELCPQRIESKGTGTGIADVWTMVAPIELKCLKNYPVKDNGPVVLEHPLSRLQYRWLNERWDAGFKAFVLVQVRRLYFHLFCAPDSHILVPGHEVSKIVWYSRHIWYSEKGIQQHDNPQSINDVLKMSREELDHDREFINGIDISKKVRL